MLSNSNLCDIKALTAANFDVKKPIAGSLGYGATCVQGGNFYQTLRSLSCAANREAKRNNALRKGQLTPIFNLFLLYITPF